MKKVIVLASVILVAIMACAVFWLNKDLCSNEYLREVRSPDGANVYKLYVRDCGATTDFVTMVDVNGRDALKVKGFHNYDISLEWLTNERLQIRISAQSEVLSQKNKVGKVDIEVKKDL